MADESGDESSEVEDLYVSDVDKTQETKVRHRFGKKKVDSERKPLLSTYEGSDFPEVWMDVSDERYVFLNFSELNF